MANIPYDNVPRVAPLDSVSTAAARSEGDVLPFDQVLQQQTRTTSRPDIERDSRSSSNEDSQPSDETLRSVADSQSQDDSPPEQADTANNDDSEVSTESNTESESGDSEEATDQNEDQESNDDGAGVTNTNDEAESAKAELELSVEASVNFDGGEVGAQQPVLVTNETEQETKDEAENTAGTDAVEIDVTAELSDESQGQGADDGDQQVASVNFNEGVELADEHAGDEHADRSHAATDNTTQVEQIADQQNSESIEAQAADPIETAEVSATASATTEQQGARDRRVSGDQEATAAVQANQAVETVVNVETDGEEWHGGNRRELGGDDTNTEGPKPGGPVTSAGSSVPNTKGLSEHLLGQAQDARNNQNPLSEADQARFVTRVTRAFQTAQDRNGAIRLRLHPPELGSLRLEIKMQGGVMTARLETETNMARTVLMESLPVLRERLAEQGIRVENFDIDLMDRSLTGEMPEDNSQSETDESETHSSTTAQTDGNESEDSRDAQITPQESSGLNVVI